MLPLLYYRVNDIDAEKNQQDRNKPEERLRYEKGR
jgi:hypothetical protein